MSSPIPEAALTGLVSAAFGNGVRVLGAESLHGDASSRRYVRVHLEGAAVPTAVVMVLGEGRFSPGSDELGGGTSAELPYVNVGRWLAARHFPIPELYADRASDDGLLLLEDVGDVTMCAAVGGPGSEGAVVGRGRGSAGAPAGRRRAARRSRMRGVRTAVRRRAGPRRAGALRRSRHRDPTRHAARGDRACRSAGGPRA